MNLRIPAAIAAVVLPLAALVALPAQADTRTGNVQFINDEANPSSFDCYTWSSTKKRYLKLNDGTDRVISRTTAYKCNKDYYLYTFTGARTTIKKANQAYYIGSIDLPFNMIDARKA